MDYELYHDESRKDGYWHLMLLVPTVRKDRLVLLLEECRKNLCYQHPVSFKKIRGEGKKSKCAESWIQIAVASLMSRTKNKPYGLYLGEEKSGKRQYEDFKGPIGCKLILFRERDELSRMEFYTDFGSKVEITFRMGFVGGLHYLGLPDEYISIDRIHFDNHEQYGRAISKYRIVDRIKGLRDYCSIPTRSDQIDDRSSDHTNDDSQAYNDCQLIQLTDLLVGGFRTLFRGSDNPIHHKIAAPIKAVLEKYTNPHHWKNSRWRNSMTLSQCHLDDGRWHFESIETQEKITDIQLPLPWLSES